MTGHLRAAGAIPKQSIPLLMLHNDFIAPSTNIETLDEAAVGCNIVTETKENAGLQTVRVKQLWFRWYKRNFRFKRYNGYLKTHRI